MPQSSAGGLGRSVRWGGAWGGRARGRGAPQASGQAISSRFFGVMSLGMVWVSTR